MNDFLGLGSVSSESILTAEIDGKLVKMMKDFEEVGSSIVLYGNGDWSCEGLSVKTLYDFMRMKGISVLKVVFSNILYKVEGLESVEFNINTLKVSKFIVSKERSLMKNKVLFASESVTSGHPDKVCDQIADAILDEALKRDAKAHMAVEATIKNNKIFIYGEGNYNSPNEIDYASVAKGVMRKIGYNENYEVIIEVSKQSEEINNLVSSAGEDFGAGDQGIIFGYACSETRSFMPLSIDLAHKLAQELENQRRTNANTVLLPDGKTQVCVEYEDESRNKIKRIDSILVSTQHRDVNMSLVRDEVMKCIDRVLVREGVKDLTEDTKILINPMGSFIVGGSFGDSGTTGRKIVVDTYGGHAKIGGGCFSSKDPSKVDRSAAYYARYVAKNIVAADLADRCEIQVSYGIGMEKPLSLHIECFGTNKVSIEEIYNIVDVNFDFRPYSMIEELNLRNPIYFKTASYGHFGREEFPWEKIIKLKINK